MSASLLPNARQQFFSATGAPLAGGFVWTYVPGTTTLKTTWQDSGEVTPNTNPIVLDSLGSAEIWGAGAYRQIVYDATGALIWDAVTQEFSSGALQAANNLSDLANVATARTNLGLGTAAVVNTGTAGATLGLLNANKTDSGANTFSALQTLSGGAVITPRAAPTVLDVGYMGIPQTTKGANYTFTLADLATEIFCTAAITVTIPAYTIVTPDKGQFLKITADVGFAVSLAVTGGTTLRWLNGNVTGNRTITGPGFAIIAYEKTGEWWVVGGAGIS